MAAGALLYRSRPASAFRTPAELAAARRASREFAAMPQIAATDRSAVAEAIRTAPAIPGQVIGVEVTDEQRAAFADTIAQWFAFRANLDAEGFAQWMRDRGHTLMIETTPDAELRLKLREDTRSKRYEQLLGVPMPEDLSALDYHHAMFRATLTYAGGLFRPVRVASAPGVMTIFMREGPEGAVLDPWDGYELWVSDTSGTGEQHWRPPTSPEALIERDGHVLKGSALVAVLGGNSKWHVLSIHLFWDPDLEQWNFSWVNYEHVTEPTAGLGVF